MSSKKKYGKIMKKLAKELEFISWINRDGSGTKKVPKSMMKMMLENELAKDVEFEINALSMSNKTFIASGFNSFVVKLK